MSNWYDKLDADDLVLNQSETVDYFVRKSIKEAQNADFDSVTPHKITERYIKKLLTTQRVLTEIEHDVNRAASSPRLPPADKEPDDFRALGPDSFQEKIDEERDDLDDGGGGSS